MRNVYIEGIKKDDNITYRGLDSTRLTNVIDAVFGIALTLLIFNISDTTSFAELKEFTKSFPALLISIVFLILVWKENVLLVLVYSIRGMRLQLLNIVFISLVIFYVHPLRYLTRLLTNLFFNTDIKLQITETEIPLLMMYYGIIAFSLYFTVFLSYVIILKKKLLFNLNSYELIYTKYHAYRLLIMSVVPLLSAVLSVSLKGKSIFLASVIGGTVYGLYPILISIWNRFYIKAKATEASR